MNKTNTIQALLVRCKNPLFKVSLFALLVVLLTGCFSFPKCLEYSWFKDRMQDCVGQDVSCVTRSYSDARLNNTVQLAQNQILYKYNLYAPPAYQGDYAHNCKLDVTVDGQTGKMISGSWEGDCDHWSYCTRREQK